MVSQLLSSVNVWRIFLISFQCCFASYATAYRVITAHSVWFFFLFYSASVFVFLYRIVISNLNLKNQLNCSLVSFPKQMASNISEHLFSYFYFVLSPFALTFALSFCLSFVLYFYLYHHYHLHHYSRAFIDDLVGAVYNSGDSISSHCTYIWLCVWAHVDIGFEPKSLYIEKRFVEYENNVLSGWQRKTGHLSPSASKRTTKIYNYNWFNTLPILKHNIL